MIRAIAIIVVCLSTLPGCDLRQKNASEQPLPGQPEISETLVLSGFEGSHSIQIDGTSISDQTFSFSSLGDAEAIVRSILATSAIEPSFKVLSTDRVSNAQAVFVKETSNLWQSRGFNVGDRVIAYNPRWIESWVGSDEFNGVVLLAHELGHHINGHTLVPGAGSTPPIELQADRYAGCAVARLNGTEDDATRLFASFAPEGTTTHPPRDARISASLEGYRSCSPTPMENTECTLEKMVGFWKCGPGRPACSSDGDVSELRREADGRYRWSDGRSSVLYVEKVGNGIVRIQDGKRTGPFAIEECSKIVWSPNRHWDQKIE